MTRLERTAAGRRLVPAPADTEPDEERRANVRRSVPQAGEPGLRILGRVGVTNPRSLEDYVASGGYQGPAACHRDRPRRGDRRSHGFRPSWPRRRGVPHRPQVGGGGGASPASPTTLVCNADESEPGTFKDRVLMEEDPYAIVEAMTIEGFATGSARGFLYIRAEYPLSAARMSHALAHARAAGYLGDDILGSGFAFDIEVRRGAGAYVCGEETALFNSIEGTARRASQQAAVPRRGRALRPAHRGEQRRDAREHPGDRARRRRRLRRHRDAGVARIEALLHLGLVRRPGVYEVRVRCDARRRDRARRRRAGRATSCARSLLGGAAGVFVGPTSLDLPLTFEATRAAGATLGSGVVVVFDETADLSARSARIAAFFRDESCGQCVPCRVGTVRQEEILARLASGRPNGSPADELALLADLGRAMRDASICGLGQTASSAIESAFGAGLVALGGRAEDHP